MSTDATPTTPEDRALLAIVDRIETDESYAARLQRQVQSATDDLANAQRRAAEATESAAANRAILARLGYLAVPDPKNECRRDGDTIPLTLTPIGDPA